MRTMSSIWHRAGRQPSSTSSATVVDPRPSSTAARRSSSGRAWTTEAQTLVQASAVPPSESLPAVVFTQSSAVSTTLPCNSGTGVPASSELADTHDFSGDGKSDIVWRDNGGNTAVWLMNGAQVIQSAGLGGADPTAWTIVGQRDFNGDGRADLLWRD